jgi:hypothetical protein
VSEGLLTKLADSGGWGSDGTAPKLSFLSEQDNLYPGENLGCIVGRETMSRVFDCTHNLMNFFPHMNQSHKHNSNEKNVLKPLRLDQAIGCQFS